jgi:ribonuclease HI
MAVSSACIAIHNNPVGSNVISNGNGSTGQNTMTTIPLALGGKLCSVPIDMTSQHAEYEGLLMGLQWLRDMYPRLVDNDFNCGGPYHLDVLIEGDCKTVLDQMSGKSSPRKLEFLYRRALALLHEISDKHQTAFDRFGKRPPNCFTVNFQHIPRTQNSVCDNLCNNLMTVVASKAWDECIYQLENASRNSSMKTNRIDSSLRMGNLLATYLDPATSRIKYSLRPPLYETMAVVANKMKDYESLLAIGQRLVEEECNNHRPQERGRFSMQKQRGVGYQIQGWRGLGQERKSRLLERKHRVALAYRADGAENEPFFHRNESVDIESLRFQGDIEASWDKNIPSSWLNLLSEWFVRARQERDAWCGKKFDESSMLWIGIL